MFLRLNSQMSTTRKRKTNNVSTQDDKRTRTQDLIYHVKAVKVSRGVYHYFGRTKTSQTEELLTHEWMTENCMSCSWRKSKLRGKRQKYLGKWKIVPVGAKTKDVPYSNPCVPGKFTRTLITSTLILL